MEGLVQEALNNKEKMEPAVKVGHAKITVIGCGGAGTNID